MQSGRGPRPARVLLAKKKIARRRCGQMMSEKGQLYARLKRTKMLDADSRRGASGWGNLETQVSDDATFREQVSKV